MQHQKSSSVKLRIILPVVAIFFAGMACQTITESLPGLAPSAPPPEAVFETEAEPVAEAVEVEAGPTESQDTASGFNPALASPDVLFAEGGSLVELYEQVSPGVVAIRILSQQGGGLGSGFVIDSEGHIATNYHVVEGASELEIAFSDGRKVRGTVIGTDLDSDLAILKVDLPPEQLHPLPLGASDSTRVGQVVVAIGNPFGLSGTMTVGIVSAKGRVLESLNASPGGRPFSAGDIIQTDAAINPGNSGGPLLNLEGEVIGINRAIRTENFTAGGDPVNTGIGFAISVDILKRVAPSLIENGSYEYPYLGVSSLSEITLFDQEQFGLPQATGALITEVTAGGPADRGGIQVGDLITAVDGREVLVFGDLLGYLLTSRAPGEEVSLSLLRNGEPLTLTVVLGTRP